MNRFTKITILTLAIIGSTILNAQTYKPGKTGGLYRTGDEKLDKGWFFGIGLTYMLPYLKKSETIDFTDTLNQKFTQTYTAKPTGNIGLFAEIGKFKINNRKIINYHDFGLSYKWFRGGEDFESTTLLNNNPYSVSNTVGSYSDHALSLHYNIGHNYDISDKKFMVNGLGLNADYFIVKSREGGGNILESPQKFVSDFVGEIHYFFGMGFKTGSRLMIMPMIETPIFSIYEFNHIKSTHDYFNTRSRPIIFRIRFMILKKTSTSCPKVYNPMGIDPMNQKE
jgi:hypothetical protein